MIIENVKGKVLFALTEKKGFSLVELIVLVGISAILMAIAVPSYLDWRERVKFRQEGRAIISLIREAKSISITGNRQQRIRMDLANRRYWLEEGNRAVASTVWVRSTRVTPDIIISPGVGVQTAGSDTDANQYDTLQINPNGMMVFSVFGGATGIAMRADILDAKNATTLVRYRVEMTQTGRVSGWSCKYPYSTTACTK